MKRNLLWTFLKRLSPGDPIQFFEQLFEKYGTIVHYKIGFEHIIFLNDPELVKEILVNQAANFTKERTQNRMKILLGEGLITSEDPYHRVQRHLAQPAFHRQRIVAYGEVMVNKTKMLSDSWLKRWQIAHSKNESLVLDVALEMMHLTLSIV